MGVIKKSDPKLGVFTSESEESLNVLHYSEDENASTSSETTPSVHSPPRRRHGILPIPMSFTSNKKQIGKKRCRRYENGHHLETLVEDEELQAVTIYDFIPDSCVGFSQVLENEENKELWETFINSSEERQCEIIGQQNNIQTNSVAFVLPQTAEEAFANIKTGLRNTLKKSHIPLGMIQNLENKVVEFFTFTPTQTFISDNLTSFERLLLHAVAQYYCLRSFSFDSEPNNVRLVKVSNPHACFHQPSILLVEFLAERRRNLQPNTHENAYI